MLELHWTKWDLSSSVAMGYFAAWGGQGLPVTQLRPEDRFTRTNPVLIQQPALPEGHTASLGLLGAGAVISAAAEALPDMPDIANRAGKSSHGAELTKCAQKVESFPSKPPKDAIAASSQQPQGSSLCSGLHSHNKNFSVKIW